MARDSADWRPGLDPLLDAHVAPPPTGLIVTSRQFMGGDKARAFIGVTSPRAKKLTALAAPHRDDVPVERPPLNFSVAPV